jgi:hypothetical protein
MTLQPMAGPPREIGFVTEQSSCARGDANWYLLQPASSGLATEVWSPRLGRVSETWLAAAGRCGNGGTVARSLGAPIGRDPIGLPRQNV